MLCDAVTVRDGLLHILGGGVGRVTRFGFPAPLDNDMALRLVLSPEEVRSQHRIEIRILTSEGAVASTVTGDFAAGTTDGPPVGVDVSLNIPVSLRQVVLPGPDRYEVEVVVDDEPLARLPVEVALVSPPA